MKKLLHIFTVAVLSFTMSTYVFLGRAPSAYAAMPAFNAVSWGYPTAATGDFSCGTSDGNDCRHTAAGDDRVVVVGIEVFDGVDDITSVTYDGNAMTLLVSSRIVVSAHAAVYYYLEDPPTTSNAVTRIQASSNNDYRVVVYSLSGADYESNPVGGAATDTGAPDTALTLTVNTTGVNNCLLVGFAFSEDAGGLAAGADTTERSGNAGYDEMYERAVVTGGSNAINITANSGNIGGIATAWCGSSVSSQVIIIE